MTEEIKQDDIPQLTDAEVYYYGKPLDDVMFNAMKAFSDEDKENFVNDSVIHRLYTPISDFCDATGYRLGDEADILNLMDIDKTLSITIPHLCQLGFTFETRSIQRPDGDVITYYHGVVKHESLSGLTEIKVSDDDPRIFVLSLLWVFLLRRFPDTKKSAEYAKGQLKVVEQFEDWASLNLVVGKVRYDQQQALSAINQDDDTSVEDDDHKTTGCAC